MFRNYILQFLNTFQHVYVKWELLGRTCDASFLPSNVSLYEGVSKSFRTCRLERELHMIQLSATRCSCIAILWVSVVSFVAITLCIASQWVFIVVSLYSVIDSVRKFLDTPSYIIEFAISLIQQLLNLATRICAQISLVEISITLHTSHTKTRIHTFPIGLFVPADVKKALHKVLMFILAILIQTGLNSRSKTSTVFGRSNIGIAGSNPARDMDVCLCFSVLHCPV
jgi:hypothetical protein